MQGDHYVQKVGRWLHFTPHVMAKIFHVQSKMGGNIMVAFNMANGEASVMARMGNTHAAKIFDRKCTFEK